MNTQKIAVVTGANRGIGYEVAHQLAKAGMKVVVACRTLANAKAAAQKLSAQGGEYIPYALDVTNQSDVDAFAKAMEKDFGRVDVLVNNAGVLLDSKVQSIVDTDLDAVVATMNTNVYGPIRMCQKILPMMTRNHFGRIINISSGMGQLSDMDGGYPGYRMSKVSLNALTRMMASEVKGSDILINSMCPGWVKTDMGGEQAPRTPAQAAETAVWLATLPKSGPNGGFYRDKVAIPW